jgi:dTDP-4-amino-4,6-dideoxy-D-galactose acyltransferase
MAASQPDRPEQMAEFDAETPGRPSYVTLLEGRVDIVGRYSPYSGIRGITPQAHRAEALREVLEIERGTVEGGQRHDLSVGQGTAAFYTRRLVWDSDFWGREVYQLVLILSDLDAHEMVKAARMFATTVVPTLGCDELRTEIPAEDVEMIQALTGAGFRSVVTQVVHVRDSLKDLEYPRFPVRIASTDDIDALRETAATMRNPYDRAHADVRTSEVDADRYLSHFAEACVRGYTDIVLVPDRAEANSIVATNLLEEEWERLGVNVSQIVLAAVSASTNRGWAIKMLYETLYLLRDRGATRVMMKTQVQNYTVHRCAHLAGFRVAASSQILLYP